MSARSEMDSMGAIPEAIETDCSWTARLSNASPAEMNLITEDVHHSANVHKIHLQFNVFIRFNSIQKRRSYDSPSERKPTTGLSGRMSNSARLSWTPCDEVTSGILRLALTSCPTEAAILFRDDSLKWHTLIRINYRRFGGNKGHGHCSCENQTRKSNILTTV